MAAILGVSYATTKEAKVGDPWILVTVEHILRGQAHTQAIFVFARFTSLSI